MFPFQHVFSLIPYEALGLPSAVHNVTQSQLIIQKRAKQTEEENACLQTDGRVVEAMISNCLKAQHKMLLNC